MAATDARPIPIKAAAYRVTFPILDADGDLVTAAAALDSEISKDGGTFVDCTNEATEIATSSGMYFLDITATEMDADTVAVIVKTTTTGAKTTPIVLYPATSTGEEIPVDTRKVAGTAQTAGDIIGDTDNIQTRLPAALVSGRMDSSVGAMAADVVTAAAIAADAIGASELAADAVAEIVNAVFDELTAEARTAGSYGQLLKDNLNATVSSRATQTSVDNIQADTDNIQTRLPAALIGGRMDSSIGAIAAGVDLSATMKASVNAEVDSALDTAIPVTPTADSVNERLKRLEEDVTPTRAGNLDNLNATVGSRAVPGDLMGIVASGITAAKFAAGAVDAAALALDAAQEIANALLDLANGVETGFTPRQALRLILAALAGKLSGAATTTIAIRDVNDLKARITGTVDADGNRTAVIYDTT